MRILSLRACSVAELTVKLRRAGYPPDATRAAVDECRKRHYLDDALLAEDCSAMWRARGHGNRSIRFKLRQRGVPEELVENAVADTGSEESDAAVAAIESRLYSLLRETDLRKRRAKALRFLAARGFSGDAVSAGMRRLKAAERDAEEKNDDEFPAEV